MVTKQTMLQVQKAKAALKVVSAAIAAIEKDLKAADKPVAKPKKVVAHSKSEARRPEVQTSKKVAVKPKNTKK